MTVLHQLAVAGQSIWLDFIRRSFLDEGKLNDLVEQGLRGVTSNPSIFHKAISSGTDYDAAIERLVEEGAGINDIYEHLAVQDIRRACNILLPVYERTGGKDGFVSLEVNPKLAYDTEGTVMEARRLFSMVDRPNVMIKVPATPAGIPAIETLIGEGINVNVTLIFSLDHYEAVADAYISGLERLAQANVDYRHVASVASFFVSRVETQVDNELPAGSRLRGHIAVANAKLAYQRFLEIFSGPRWERLAGRGARVQRPLWASTSTKDPDYSPTLYVDNLIGPDTVNTLPPDTLERVLAMETFERTIDADVAEARGRIEQLAAAGVDLDAITQQLQIDGVNSFADSFDALMQAITEKVESIRGGSMNSLTEHTHYDLGSYRERVDKALEEMESDKIVPRIWAHSHTVWSSDPEEITNRLGWLRIAETMRREKGCIEALAKDLDNEQISCAVVLGMGGSSLAPEVFGKLFHSSGIDVLILDSTHPDAVSALTEQIDPAETLFIVSTKSGSTVETLSLFKYFYTITSDAVGADAVGSHFVAITDPGSKLVALADAHAFRATFINDPDIGGRYSALSYFGLVPACLSGADLNRLLRRSLDAMNDCGSHVSAADNPGAVIGATLAELAQAGRDKLTVISSPKLAPVGDWLEQLIAESTGKSGTGILPVVGEAVASPDHYGSDRLFVYLQMSDEDSHANEVAALVAAGHPLIRVQLRDIYDLGAQFFLWEFATAVAGARLGTHPFNQPNVEAAKSQTRNMLERYRQTGTLPEVESSLRDGEMSVAGALPVATSAATVADALNAFLQSGTAGDYVAIQAYIAPTRTAEAALRSMQAAVRDSTGLATTLGFGPRFLHSTGQMHKGDGGNGLFIQFVDQPEAQVDVPDKAGSKVADLPFGMLLAAQALGDRQALLNENRRVLRIDLGAHPIDQVKALTAALLQEA